MIATASAHHAKATVQRLLAKDLSTVVVNALSFLTSVPAFQAIVHPETATVPKDNALQDNLTTEALAQKANALRATMIRVLRVHSTTDRHAITRRVRCATMTTTISNPVPMRTWAPKAASMPLAINHKVAVSASLTPHAPAST